MALPISVPYSFANATTSIPLSQLDTDISTIYATVNGIGNGTVALSNVVITGGIISNVSGISSSSISNGTSNVSIATANGSVVVSTVGNTAITVDTSQNMTAVGTVAMASSFKRNRIINGNMLIDQRNAGASVTTVSGQNYPVDRTFVACSQASKFTTQQSSVAPTGFLKSALVTVANSYSPLSTDDFAIRQAIEGFNVSDLGWGSAAAQTITLTFWVRSSITGTYSLSVRNGSVNRSYVTTYSVLAANTWEQKTIVVVGDTSGTWATDNTIGIVVGWDLGQGSNYNTSTTNAWQAGNYNRTSSSVSFVSQSNGATFYLTGVQLEVGTKATPYEMQIYSDQLAQCQRYFQTSGVKPGTASGAGACAITNYGTTAGIGANQCFEVAMRTSPTFTVYDGAGNSGVQSYYSGAWNNGGGISSQNANSQYFYVQCNVSGAVSQNYNFSASAEL